MDAQTAGRGTAAGSVSADTFIEVHHSKLYKQILLLWFMLQMQLTPDLIGPPGPTEAGAGRRLRASALNRQEKDRPDLKKKKKKHSPHRTHGHPSLTYIKVAVSE